MAFAGEADRLDDPPVAVTAVMDRAALRERVQHALFVLGNVHVECARQSRKRPRRPTGTSRRVERMTTAPPAKPGPSGQRATISFILPSGVVNAADVPFGGGFVKIWGCTKTIFDKGFRCLADVVGLG